jgi:hypothetical protein
LVKRQLTMFGEDISGNLNAFSADPAYLRRKKLLSVGRVGFRTLKDMTDVMRPERTVMKQDL